ncbi:MAG: diguanylate cyclase [Bacillus subtilis]|nr:diguanylate cyclase [Bacillus subtilis]
MRVDLILIGVTIAMAIIAIVIAFLIFTRIPRRNGLWQIGTLFVFGFVYALGYAFELMAETEPLKAIFNHVQYFAIPFLSTIWLVVAVRFKNPGEKITLKRLWPFTIMPMIVFFAVQLSYFSTVDWYYKSFSMDTSLSAENLGLALLVIEKGFLYYINAAYNFVLVALTSQVYLRIFFHSSGIQKRQSLVMSLVSLVTLAATVPIFFSRYTYGIDISLYLYFAVGYVILYATVKYEVFDLAPSAHRATFEHAGDPMMILDDRFEIIAWNQSLDKYRTKQLTYRMPLHRYFPETGIIKAITTQTSYSFSFADKRFIIETMPLLTKRGRINGYLVMFNDMTAYLEKIERLDFDASHDTLTKMLNRRAFFERVERYFENTARMGESFAVIMIDIDDFKRVNDTYGHLIGDLVLEDLSKALTNHLPDATIFSRYGGEEFVGLIPETSVEEAMNAADIARSAISVTPFNYGDIAISLTVSIGVCQGVVDGNQLILDSIHRADMALYEAKAAGKNRVAVSKPA